MFPYEIDVSNGLMMSEQRFVLVYVDPTSGHKFYVREEDHESVLSQSHDFTGGGFQQFHLFHQIIAGQFDPQDYNTTLESFCGESWQEELASYSDKLCLF